MKAITNVVVFTGTDEGILTNVAILIDDGKIADIVNSNEVPGDIVTIDGKGQYLYPGFVDAHSHIGIDEEIIKEVGQDENEMVDPLTPQMRGIDGVNPMDGQFKEARQAGVTTVAIGPGSANTIGGTFVALKTQGNIVDQMVLKNPLAMKAALGENPKRIYKKMNKSPYTRMGVASVIREAFLNAKSYKKRKRRNIHMYNEKYEALIPVLNKELPVKFHAHRADDIATAIRLAEELDIEYTIEHATEGHLIADYLADHEVKCIIGPTFGVKSKEEVRNKTFKTGYALYKAGVKFAIMTDCPVLPEGSLPLQARLYIEAGLPREEALKAITSNAAEILGLEDRVGSIAKGLDADFVLMKEKALTTTCPKVAWTMINGEIVYSK